jgi:phosphoglycolate phosphatase
MSEIARKSVKAILFDKDGTLIDFNDTWFVLYQKLALEAANGDAALGLQLLIRGGYDPAAHTFLAGSELAAGTTPDIVRLWLPDASGVEFDAWCERLNRAFIDEGPLAAVPVKGLEETLVLLHGAGIKLAVVTNDLEQAAENTMQRFGLRHLFSAVLGYDSVPDPKPAAGPVLKFCRDNDCRPSEVLVIGDNGHDIEMARNAGAAYAIGVMTGTGTREVLSQGSDAVLNSIADLPEWLGLG